MIDSYASEMAQKLTACAKIRTDKELDDWIDMHRYAPTALSHILLPQLLEERIRRHEEKQKQDPH